MFGLVCIITISWGWELIEGGKEIGGGVCEKGEGGGTSNPVGYTQHEDAMR